MGLEKHIKLQYAKREVLGIIEVNSMNQTMDTAYRIVYFGQSV